MSKSTTKRAKGSAESIVLTAEIRIKDGLNPGRSALVSKAYELTKSGMPRAIVVSEIESMIKSR